MDGVRASVCAGRSGLEHAPDQQHPVVVSCREAVCRRWLDGMGAGAIYFNRGSFGIGPAAVVRYTSNSQYTKTSLYPSFAMQCRTTRWRVEAFVHFRDQWTRNHGRGGGWWFAGN